MSKLNINNPFFQFMNTLASFILLNILFLITCIPIITIGAAMTSLYSVTLAYAKEEQSYFIKGYFKSFKQNFKQGTQIWLLLLTVALILVFNMSFWHTLGSLLGTVLFILMGLVLTVASLCYLYVFPLLARFTNGTLQTIKNAIFIAFLNLKYSILMLAINSLLVFLLYHFPPVAMLFMVFGITFTAYIQSFIFNRVFKTYEPTVEEPLK